MHKNSFISNNKTRAGMQKPMIHWLVHSSGASHVVFHDISSSRKHLSCAKATRAGNRLTFEMFPKGLLGSNKEYLELSTEESGFRWRYLTTGSSREGNAIKRYLFGMGSPSFLGLTGFRSRITNNVLKKVGTQGY